MVAITRGELTTELINLYIEGGRKFLVAKSGGISDKLLPEAVRDEVNYSVK